MDDILDLGLGFSDKPKANAALRDYALENYDLSDPDIYGREAAIAYNAMESAEVQNKMIAQNALLKMKMLNRIQKAYGRESLPLSKKLYELSLEEAEKNNEDSTGAKLNIFQKFIRFLKKIWTWIVEKIKAFGRWIASLFGKQNDESETFDSKSIMNAIRNMPLKDKPNTKETLSESIPEIKEKPTKYEKVCEEMNNLLLAHYELVKGKGNVAFKPGVIDKINEPLRLFGESSKYLIEKLKQIRTSKAVHGGGYTSASASNDEEETKGEDGKMSSIALASKFKAFTIMNGDKATYKFEGSEKRYIEGLFGTSGYAPDYVNPLSLMSSNYIKGIKIEVDKTLKSINKFLSNIQKAVDAIEHESKGVEEFIRKHNLNEYPILKSAFDAILDYVKTFNQLSSQVFVMPLNYTVSILTSIIKITECAKRFIKLSNKHDKQVAKEEAKAAKKAEKEEAESEK